MEDWQRRVKLLQEASRPGGALDNALRQWGVTQQALKEASRPGGAVDNALRQWGVTQQALKEATRPGGGIAQALEQRRTAHDVLQRGIPHNQALAIKASIAAAALRVQEPEDCLLNLRRQSFLIDAFAQLDQSDTSETGIEHTVAKISDEFVARYSGASTPSERFGLYEVLTLEPFLIMLHRILRRQSSWRIRPA